MNEQATNCPVCQKSNSIRQEVDSKNCKGVFSEFKCQDCGQFQLTDLAARSIENLINNDPKNIARFRYFKTKCDSNRGVPLIKEFQLREILKRSLPKTQEMLDNLILYLGENTSLGEFIEIPNSHIFEITGLEHIAGILVLKSFTNAYDQAYFELFNKSSHTVNPFKLTVQGWFYYESLQQAKSRSHRCFMAMSYSNDRLANIVEEDFKPAIKQTGFILRRLDDEQKAGLIDDHLRLEIRSSRFVIADLTDANNGAYWEAGYAEGLGKPVIYTCEKAQFEKEQPHFDTNHHLIVLWDIEDREKTKEKLKATIRATLPEEAQMEDTEQ